MFTYSISLGQQVELRRILTGRRPVTGWLSVWLVDCGIKHLWVVIRTGLCKCSPRSMYSTAPTEVSVRIQKVILISHIGSVWFIAVTLRDSSHLCQDNSRCQKERERESEDKLLCVFSLALPRAWKAIWVLVDFCSHWLIAGPVQVVSMKHKLEQSILHCQAHLSRGGSAFTVCSREEIDAHVFSALRSEPQLPSLTLCLNQWVPFAPFYCELQRVGDSVPLLLSKAL